MQGSDQAFPLPGLQAPIHQNQGQHQVEQGGLLPLQGLQDSRQLRLRILRMQQLPVEEKNGHDEQGPFDQLLQQGSHECWSLTDSRKNRRKPTERVVLGIDPGTSVMGYSAIRITGNKLTLLGIGDLRMKRGKDLTLRLKEIFDTTLGLIEEYPRTRWPSKRSSSERTFRVC